MTILAASLALVLVAFVGLTIWRSSTKAYVGEALYSAAQGRDLPLTKKLLSEGAPADSFFESSFTPLSAAVENDDLEMAETLLKAGADPNLSCQLGKPIHFAISRKMKDLLKKYGAKP